MSQYDNKYGLYVSLLIFIIGLVYIGINIRYPIQNVIHLIIAIIFGIIYLWIALLVLIEWRKKKENK